LLRTLVFLAGSAGLAALLLALQPPMSTPQVAAPTGGSTLAVALEQILIKQQNRSELSESEINQSLVAKATVPQLSCAIWDSAASLYLTWKIGNLPVTARIDFTVKRQGAEHEVQIFRGAYGRLEVPRGMLILLRPALGHLSQHYAPELAALFALPRFSFEPGTLVLQPKF
jgi:hypothetical protein